MKKNTILIPLLTSVFLIGCATGGTPTDDSSHIDIISETNLDIDPDTVITEDSAPNAFDEREINEENVEVPTEYDSFSDGVISKAGKYYLKGDYASISITASKGTELYIFMDGVNISSNTGIAFGSSKQVKLHLVLLNDSVNNISNDYLDENAFHVKGEVHLSGHGILNAESKQKNGVKVSKDFYIYEGVTLNAKGYNHAITARSITSNGAVISAIAETKDGIQLECDDDVIEFTNEQGFAYLINTKFTSDTYGDGIQADTYVYIKGGEYDITTHGEFISYSVSNMQSYGLEESDFKYVKSGETYKRVATDEIRQLSSSYYALANSVKGIKAGAIEYDSDADDEDDAEVTTGDYQVYIAHLADIKINSTDDCISAKYGKVTIESSNLQLETFDDGVHATYDLSVNNVSINIAKSYEGLEGANVVVDGDKTIIIANSQDDGINAANTDVQENNITIKNGYLRVFAEGDGLDANTALNLEGGVVIVEGPGRGNGSLDASKINFKGGIVLALSTSGMTERMEATQYTFAYQGSTINQGTKIYIVNSDGNALVSYTLKQSCNQIIFSHPSMEANQTYVIVAGENTLASITMTSTLVKSGINQGGPGGPGRP